MLPVQRASRVYFSVPRGESCIVVCERTHDRYNDRYTLVRKFASQLRQQWKINKQPVPAIIFNPPNFLRKLTTRYTDNKNTQARALFFISILTN